MFRRHGDWRLSDLKKDCSFRECLTESRQLVNLLLTNQPESFMNPEIWEEIVCAKFKDSSDRLLVASLGGAQSKLLGRNQWTHWNKKKTKAERFQLMLLYQLVVYGSLYGLFIMVIYLMKINHSKSVSSCHNHLILLVFLKQNHMYPNQSLLLGAFLFSHAIQICVEIC